ncbi:winged helix-turn-helix domain-containing protein [uncultured Nitratireductor sp.]|uniref:winged helix-turn-helix domain-containing protein n=1 Tax=uncultured Nitratireductor sp. TaxID=520953 RepID=UPI0026227E77|nr:winged helix-turn-helix domain-containing protein [uncultured Nitratireductor sp.]
MQPDCTCPVCGSSVTEIPVTILPERGMVVANGRFANLTGHEMLILQRLAEVFPRVLSKEAALEWMYQFNPDEEPEIKIIDVYVCKVRKKLAPIGVRIDTLWGKGYALAISSKPQIVSEAA